MTAGSDEFNVSSGNLMLLRLLPEMMNIPKWRAEIRDVVLSYIIEKQKKK
jgi:hypothetical protein